MLICRACGEQHPSEEGILTNLQKYLDIYYNLTSIKLPSDEDPDQQRICDGCRLKLLEFNRFRTICLQVHYRLTEIKKEPLVEDTECLPIIEELKLESLEPIDEQDPCKTDTDHEREDDALEDSKEEGSSEEEMIESELLSEDEEDSDSEHDKAIEQKPKRKNKPKVEKEDSKEKVFKCDQCSQKFRSEVRYQGHLRVHQGLKPAVCKLCGKDFNKYSSLKIHVSRLHTGDYKRHTCDHPGCERVYSTRQGKLRHMRKFHDPNFIQPEKRHICEKCGKAFSSYDSLKKHDFTHTGELPFQCDVCNKRTLTIYDLRKHKMRHEGIKNFVCPYCGMKKTTRTELKVHINYHTLEKQFPCKVCDKVFNNIGNMQRHVRVVHCGIRAFSCTYCDRSFGKAETLKHHVMTHTGEKPHECKTCGKRFIQVVALQTHMKTHRKGEAQQK